MNLISDGNFYQGIGMDHIYSSGEFANLQGLPFHTHKVTCHCKFSVPDTATITILDFIKH